jgi:ribosome-binding protein aMBF1 (putative translation factor)
MTICEGKTIERAPLKFCIGCAIFEAEKEKKRGKKRRNDLQHQTRDISDTHVTPVCREHIDITNTVLKSRIWLLDGPSCTNMFF